MATFLGYTLYGRAFDNSAEGERPMIGKAFGSLTADGVTQRIYLQQCLRYPSQYASRKSASSEETHMTEGNFFAVALSRL